MAVLEIMKVPHPILRRKARKVEQFGSQTQQLIDDMVETMRAAPGVGLAAPQVNVPLRAIIVEFGDEEDEKAPSRLYTVLNPEIVQISGEMVSGMEGCLSIPGFIGEILRDKAITIKGQNRYGQNIRLKVKGWVARIFQHEIDHLNGILFTDRTDKVYRQEKPEPDEPVIGD